MIECIKRGCEETTMDLLKSGIDCISSGSTCTGVLIHLNLILSFNIGDSRTICGIYNKSSWGYKQLTDDHKPERPDERDRILSKGGIIEKLIGKFNKKDHFNNHIGPMRVWHPNRNGPGLAMSRSFGDYFANSLGTVSDAGKYNYIEISVTNISASTKFIVVASDGVWEFMTNDDVIGIVRNYYQHGNTEMAANIVIKESLNKWYKNEISTDDITCIIIFLDIKKL